MLLNIHFDDNDDNLNNESNEKSKIIDRINESSTNDIESFSKTDNKQTQCNIQEVDLPKMINKPLKNKTHLSY